MKPETVFRTGQVMPFLKQLSNTAVFPIQQVTIVGDPDILLCICGLFVGLEIKAVKGKTSPMQEYKLDAIRKAGGLALVANPNNWEQVKDLLTKLSEGALHEGQI